jgi:uncharacterized protein YllA (UPF0747 family)
MPVERDSRAGLFRDDPERFARWIDHLTAADPRLGEWAGPLRRGEAVVILTGQQPALLAGPLYTLYKALTAVAAARRMRASGRAAIAAFWCVGDDTDIGEVAWTSWPPPDGPPRRLRDESVPQGERIGSLPASRMADAIRKLEEDWPSHPISSAISDISEMTWSQFLDRSLKFLCAEEPLLFVDGNDPETIRTAQGWLRGFIAQRGEIAERIDRLAVGAREAGEAPPIGAEEGRRSLFVVDGQSRRVLGEEEIEVGSDDLLLPNVVLRPALQEYLLPVERVVCGEGEIAYRRLLGPVYEVTGNRAAPWMHRFSATLFPPGWQDSGGGPDPFEVLERPEETIDAMARRAIDPALLKEVEETRVRILDLLVALEEPSARLDKSLPQLLNSVTGKVDFQVRRVEEAILTKARAALLRRSPALANLREVLTPRGRPQERGFTLWTPFAIEGMRAIRDLEGAVEAWLARGESGHALLAMEGEADGEGEGEGMQRGRWTNREEER